jgi:hypothetical protein
MRRWANVVTGELASQQVRARRSHATADHDLYDVHPVLGAFSDRRPQRRRLLRLVPICQQWPRMLVIGGPDARIVGLVTSAVPSFRAVSPFQH